MNDEASMRMWGNVVILNISLYQCYNTQRRIYQIKANNDPMFKISLSRQKSVADQFIDK